MSHFHPLDYLDAAVTRNPQGIALASPAQELTYENFYKLVKQCAAKLREAGVRPGDVVVTKLSPYWEWIFMMAAHHEAAIVCSGAGVPNPPPFDINWVITDTHGVELRAGSHIVVDQTWINEAQAISELPQRIEYESPESICVLMMTSGTTGSPKGAAFTVTNCLERMTYLPLYGSADTPELCLMGLSTIGGYYIAMNAAKNAFAYLAVNAINPETVEFAARQDIENLIGSSMQLDAFMDVVDTGGFKFPTITRLTTAGAITPTAVFERIKRVFNAEVISIYGATETGGVVHKTITFGDAPNDAGTIDTWAELEIVDEHDHVVGADVVGKIRCRSIGTVTGYFRDPVATSEKFRHGWFYPGDLGSLSEDGHLFIGGREDEIINIGGVKFDPAIIDDFAKKLPHVLDAATARIQRDDQLPQLAIALVGDADFDVAVVEQALRDEFPDRHPTIYAQVESIPRNQMRKVMRQQIAINIIEQL